MATDGALYKTNTILTMPAYFLDFFFSCNMSYLPIIIEICFISTVLHSFLALCLSVCLFVSLVCFCFSVCLFVCLLVFVSVCISHSIYRCFMDILSSCPFRHLYKNCGKISRNNWCRRFFVYCGFKRNIQNYNFNL